MKNLLAVLIVVLLSSVSSFAQRPFGDGAIMQDGGVLNISGTGLNDNIAVLRIRNSPTVFVIWRGAVRIHRFSGVTSLVIRTYGGNDRVENLTELPSTIYGGDGDDTLIGGTGDDFIDGGEGVDKIIDKQGRNTIVH
jgi:Ca2+-binding RTX toxin-like protein